LEKSAGHGGGGGAVRTHPSGVNSAVYCSALSVSEFSLAYWAHCCGVGFCPPTVEQSRAPLVCSVNVVVSVRSTRLVPSLMIV
jgi:hypothetical protein